MPMVPQERAVEKGWLMLARAVLAELQVHTQHPHRRCAEAGRGICLLWHIYASDTVLIWTYVSK